MRSYASAVPLAPPPVLLAALAALALAASGLAWEQNLHRQMVFDALALAPPEVKDYFTYGPCNIARYAETSDLVPLSHGESCVRRSVEEQMREIEAARAALFAVPAPRAFDLHKLIHRLADLYSPPKRMDCLAQSKTFYEQNDINGFVLGEGGLAEFNAAFTRPALHALVTRSDAMAYIVSVNAALRLMKEYHASRNAAPVPSPPMALYRVNFIKTAFGGQKLARSYESTAVSADGSYSYSNYNQYVDEGTAEDVNYINQCSLLMLGMVLMPGEKETLALADFHNNTDRPARQANIMVDDQEYLVPLGLAGFGDAIAFFSLNEPVKPRKVRLCPPTNPVVRTVTLHGAWASEPGEVGVNGAVDSLDELRLLLPSDIVKGACRAQAPAKGTASPPPRKTP